MKTQLLQILPKTVGEKPLRTPMTFKLGGCIGSVFVLYSLGIMVGVTFCTVSPRLFVHIVDSPLVAIFDALQILRPQLRLGRLIQRLEENRSRVSAVCH